MRIALTLLFLPLLGGCPTLFDGKLDCPIGTKACLDLAASYDADPAAVWARVERANNALRLGSAVLCASTGACVPLPEGAAAIIEKIQSRVAAGGGDGAGAREIIADVIAEVDPERAAAIESAVAQVLSGDAVIRAEAE